MTLQKPRKMVDLDGKKQHVLNEENNYVLNGQIWNWLRIGCMVCMAEDEADLQFQTLRNQNNECFCMTHGKLDLAKYSTKREWSINIDGEIRTGIARDARAIYIPASYSTDEKAALLEEIFAEYKALEEEFD